MDPKPQNPTPAPATLPSIPLEAAFPFVPRPGQDRFSTLVAKFQESGKISSFGFDQSFLIELLIQQASRGRWLSVTTSPDNLALNQRLVLPLMQGALQGEKESRNLYETERIFQYASTPEWAQPLVRELLSVRIRTYVPGSRLAPEHRSARAIIEKFRFPYEPEETPAALGLAFVCSYRTITEFLTRARRIPYDESEGWRVFHHRGQRVVTPLELYSPISPGPVGAHARDTLEMASNLMLRALVIEDLLTAQGISLSTTLKRQILRSLSSAWQLGDQPSARNLPAFQQFFAAQVPPLPAGDVERLTERYLFRPEGLVELQHFFQRNKPPSPMEPVEPVVQRSPATEIYREQFIHGLMAVIQRESPNTEEPREVARRFYSLFRRGACNYAQVVFELSAGADPYTLLGTIYTRELKRSNNQVPQRKGDHIRPTFQLSDEPHRRLIVVRNTGVFDRWITDMPDEVQARIRGRLVRVELGNLGDWSAISNRIHELRCDIGPGYRLYFSRASECEFLFLCGGNKDSQARDIRRAQLLLSLFKG